MSFSLYFESIKTLKSKYFDFKYSLWTGLQKWVIFLPITKVLELTLLHLILTDWPWKSNYRFFYYSLIRASLSFTFETVFIIMSLFISFGLGIARKSLSRDQVLHVICLTILSHMVSASIQLTVSSAIINWSIYSIVNLMFIVVIKRNIHEVMDKLKVIRALVDNRLIHSKISVMKYLYTVLPFFYLIKVSMNFLEVLFLDSMIIRDIIVVCYLYILVYLLRARVYHLRDQILDIDLVSEGLVRHYKLHGINGMLTFTISLEPKLHQWVINMQRFGLRKRKSRPDGLPSGSKNNSIGFERYLRVI